MSLSRWTMAGPKSGLSAGSTNSPGGRGGPATGGYNINNNTNRRTFIIRPGPSEPSAPCLARGAGRQQDVRSTSHTEGPIPAFPSLLLLPAAGALPPPPSAVQRHMQSSKVLGLSPCYWHQSEAEVALFQEFRRVWFVPRLWAALP